RSCAAISIASGDGARTVGVAVLKDRKDQTGLIALSGVVGMESFHDVPAVVLTAGAHRRLKVDLFVQVLADIADEKIARLAIEREAPRISQAVSPDFVTGIRASDERIQRRNPGRAVV